MGIISKAQTPVVSNVLLVKRPHMPGRFRFVVDLREIIVAASPFMAPGGLLALETGIAQHAELMALAAAHGFERIESSRDLTGRDRFIFAWKPGARGA
jgi:release factor glutamine methyltransferase